jgi:predicted PurR-regulated permease PerM
MADDPKTEEKKEHAVEHKAELPASGRHMSERKGVVLFAVLGAIIGYASYAINQPLYSLALALIVAVALWLVLKKALRLAEDRKWWSAKIILYAFMWLVVWTILFNAFIVRAL